MNESLTPKGGSRNTKMMIKKEKGRPAGIRNVLAVGLVSFFTDFSVQVALGVIPLFLVSSLGVSRASLGVTEGSSTCRLCL